MIGIGEASAHHGPRAELGKRILWTDARFFHIHPLMPKDYHFKSDARTDRAISVIKDSTGATISSIARRAIVAYAEWIQPIEPKKKRKP